MSKRVAIYGVSGFVGKGLAPLLAAEGWEVIGVSRKGTGNLHGVSSWQTPDGIDLSGCQAVINLAGEPIDQYWTASKKQAFHASRIGITEQIVKKIADLPSELRPRVLVNASAVGYYGDRGDETLTESASPGEGYLADLCKAWENAAASAEALGVRVVRLRIGVVLGKDGRAFQKLEKVFRLGLGGRLGSGEQWTPWIHVDDLRRAIVFSLTHENVSGAVNGTAPNPVTNAELTRLLAKAVGRWVFFPVPGLVLKLVLGGFGAALLGGQRALPKQWLVAGFEYRYSKLEDALEDLID